MPKRMKKIRKKRKKSTEIPVNLKLYKKIEQLAKGSKRKMKHKGIEVTAPRKGKGFRSWPGLPANIWVMKTYKRLGGKVKGVKTDSRQHKKYKEKRKTKKANFEVVSNLSRYDGISFVPPEPVRKVAKRALEWREKNGGKGGTSVGVARARDLANGKTLSPSTIRRMFSFFSRHNGNQKTKGGEQPWQDEGRISWDLWGGNVGFTWVKKTVAAMDRADASEKKQKKQASRLSRLAQAIRDQHYIQYD
jgi:hypothetical protein